MLTICLFVLASSKLQLSYEEKSFISWMRANNQAFMGDEYHFRLGVFLTNSRYIKEFNSRNKSFTLGPNKFACYTESEYQAIIGSVPSIVLLQPQPQYRNIIYTKPDSVDWRKKGMVNEIKDQGQCSAGYVFAMIQACESGYALTHTYLPSFSDQNLLDCTTESQGCYGGTLDDVINRIVHYQQGYLMYENDYPYEGYKHATCSYSSEKAVYVSINYIVGNYGNEERVAEFVATGVCATMIDASHTSFQLYSSGIYDEPDCSSTRTTHGVGIVGYGTDGSIDYWLVRNSWGTQWGEEG